MLGRFRLLLMLLFRFSCFGRFFFLRHEEPFGVSSEGARRLRDVGQGRTSVRQPTARLRGVVLKPKKRPLLDSPSGDLQKEIVAVGRR